MREEAAEDIRESHSVDCAGAGSRALKAGMQDLCDGKNVRSQLMMGHGSCLILYPGKETTRLEFACFWGSFRLEPVRRTRLEEGRAGRYGHDMVVTVQGSRYGCGHFGETAGSAGTG